MKDLVVRVTAPLANGGSVKSESEVPEALSWAELRKWRSSFGQMIGWERPALEMLDMKIFQGLVRQRNLLKSKFPDAILFDDATFEWLHSDGRPYDVVSLERGHVSQALGEDKVPYLKVTQVVLSKGAGMKFEATIPVDGVPVSLLRDYIRHGSLGDDRDNCFMVQKIGEPIGKKFLAQLNKRGALYSKAQFSRIKDLIDRTWNYWMPVTVHDDLIKFELVNADGTPYDPAEFGRNAMDDLLREGEEELGWVDPNGVLVPRGLYGEISITFKLISLDRVAYESFTIRSAIPWDVEWAKAKKWFIDHVISSFSSGPPFNLTNIEASPDEMDRLKDIEQNYSSWLDDVVRYRSRRSSAQSYAELVRLLENFRWVTKDGSPYPTTLAQKRQVSRMLSGE